MWVRISLSAFQKGDIKMSRSYKHTTRAGDKKDKFFKRYANKKLRRNKLNHNL